MTDFPNDLLRRTSAAIKLDGQYDGKIRKTEVKQFNSTRTASGKRYAFLMQVDVFVDEDTTKSLIFAPTIDWDNQSAFVRSLKSLECYPKENEEVNTRYLKGMPVTVTVKTNETEDEIYHNIVSIEKRSIAAVSSEDIKEFEEELDLD